MAGRGTPWMAISGIALAAAVAALVFALRPWERGATEAPPAEAAAPAPAAETPAPAPAGPTPQQVAEAAQAQQQQAAQELARADDNAWNVARRADTRAGYDAYLSAYPNGRHAAEARTARNRPAPPPATPATYDVAQLNPQVRAAAEAARNAESRANAAAQRGRAAAQQAEQTGNYEPREGYGVSDGSGGYAGNRYSGQFRDGTFSGLGVYVWGDNTNNRDRALRYEGEFGAGNINGVGVHQWRDGERYAGTFRNGVRGGGPGVGRLANGRRYEGEWSGDAYNGHGVLWTADGRVAQAGVWRNGALETSLTR